MTENSNERLDSNGNPIGDRAEGNQWKDKGKEIRLADGTIKEISPPRMERLEYVGSRLTRGDSLKEVERKLEDHPDIDKVSYRQLQKDKSILKEMQKGGLANKILFNEVNDLIQQAEEAKKELWQVLEDEKSKPIESKTQPDGDKEETSNSFARIKAVKGAFKIQKDIIKTLSQLGLDMKRIQSMEETNDNVSDLEKSEIDQEIENLMPSEDK